MLCKVGFGDNAVFTPADIGSVSIQPKCTRLLKYLYALMPLGHSGWHKCWFYLCNDGPRPFPTFTMRVISEHNLAWDYGPAKDEQLGIEDAVEVIQALKAAGLDGSVVLGFYHQRRFTPLMARNLPMFRVAPEERKVGANMMAEVLLPDAEVQEMVKAGVGPNHTSWPMDRCPGMVPGEDSLDVVRVLSSPIVSNPVPRQVCVNFPIAFWV